MTILQYLHMSLQIVANGYSIFEAGCSNYMLVTATRLLTNFLSL
jgi:hypothetical protein